MTKERFFVIALSFLLQKMQTIAHCELQDSIKHILQLDEDCWYYLENETLFLVFHATYRDLLAVEDDTTCYDVNLTPGDKWYGDNWGSSWVWTTLTKECPTFPDIPLDEKTLQFRYIIFSGS